MLFQLTRVFHDGTNSDDALINRKLPRELLLRILSYLDVVALCRCAQVCRYWNILALDGSNWQRINLFDFQTDVEVSEKGSLVLKRVEISCVFVLGSNNRKYFCKMWWFFATIIIIRMQINWRFINKNISAIMSKC